MEYKTNVMRLLDKEKIPYKSYCYEGTGAISGIEVAAILKQNPKQVFKTLVTIGKSQTYYVFMVPVACELDLKKAASSVHEKAVSMVKTKDLLSITGYVHGGCSPLGMKKTFTTVIDSSVTAFSTFICSAGKIGYQIEISLASLENLLPILVKPITCETSFIEKENV